MIETLQTLEENVDAYEVDLPLFQGPLDLLLYLIKRQNLDILDLPIAAITAQYMEYVDLMRQVNEATTTSRLKPSSSIRRAQTLAKASWNASRTASMSIAAPSRRLRQKS